jgi:hypothetical protein
MESDSGGEDVAQNKFISFFTDRCGSWITINNSSAAPAAVHTRFSPYIRYLN